MAQNKDSRKLNLKYAQIKWRNTMTRATPSYGSAVWTVTEDSCGSTDTAE